MRASRGRKGAGRACRLGAAHTPQRPNRLRGTAHRLILEISITDGTGTKGDGPAAEGGGFVGTGAAAPGTGAGDGPFPGGATPDHCPLSAVGRQREISCMNCSGGETSYTSTLLHFTDPDY